MSIIQGADVGGTANGISYSILKSLRFRSSTSAYLNRTFSTPTDSAVWTYSCWVKRSGPYFPLFHSIGSGYYEYIGFSGDNLLWVIRNSVGTVYRQFVANGVFRDYSAHYHIVFRKTSSLVVEIFVNGAPCTLTTQSAGSPVASLNTTATVIKIGYMFDGVSTTYAEGYLSDVNFIDGQALDPSYFGEVNANGVWVPKAYSSLYGNNGFYLDFSDGSYLTTLGYDHSSNNNDWTSNGHSLTSGINYDWMDDTPTNNYATLNPLLDTQSYATLSNGALSIATSPNNGWGPRMIGISTMQFPLAKTYYEHIIGSTNDVVRVGSINSNRAQYSLVLNDETITYSLDGVISKGGVPQGTYATYTTNDIIGVAVDLVSNTCAFYKNGMLQATVTGLTTGVPYYALTTVGASASASTSHVNFGQQPLRGLYVSGSGNTYTGTGEPPTGFLLLCTANLPAVTIPNPAQHFDVLTHSSTGSGTIDVTGTQFTPGFVWAKSRNDSNNHVLVDVIRGVNKPMSSNLTAAETSNDCVAAFLSNGFTASGTDNDNISLNCSIGSARNYVDWLWKADGTTVSGTGTGGITNVNYSANPLAGFSIVTYKGSGANGTVTHGLGVAPKLVIVKQRSVGTIEDWEVWHTGITNTERLQLNSTAAKVTSAVSWNSTSPTTSVISLGTHQNVNQSTKDFVAYCFAEIPGYSKMGSYVGNGSTDGPFVYCGFRPKYIMVKRTDSTGNWYVLDSDRNTYNLTSAMLLPNLSAAEFSNTEDNKDILSNGFKIRTLNIESNSNGASYIFYAIAEHPFGGNNVSPSPAR
jgi:hypothetical protein